MAGADAIGEAWEQLLEHWDDDQAHERFVGLCAALGELPEAGRRYRMRHDSTDDEAVKARAQRQMDRLVAVALANLSATKSTAERRRRPRLLLVAAGVVLTMIGLTVWSLLRST